MAAGAGEPTREHSIYNTVRPRWPFGITFANATRNPTASGLQLGQYIWNTDDGGPNVFKTSTWVGPANTIDGWENT